MVGVLAGLWADRGQVDLAELRKQAVVQPLIETSPGTSTPAHGTILKAVRRAVDEAASQPHTHRQRALTVLTQILNADADTVLAEVDSDRLAVTLANHTVVGGLFKTVAAEAVRRGVHRTITPVALPDEFLAAGALPTLHDRYDLSTRRIAASVLERL